MTVLDESLVRRELNPQQAEAVLVCDRPQLVLAGAGSGKTRVLTWKIAWLQGALGRNPWNLLALTFTNKAAREMRERAARLCGADAPEWMGTFHGICARILRRDAGALGYGDAFSIHDADDQKKLLGDILRSRGLDKPSPDAMRRMVSGAKNRGEGPSDWEGAENPALRALAPVFVDYQRRLREQDAMDFDDLLGNALRLLEDHPERADAWRKRFRYVLVDEYQDTNAVQYRIVRQLSGHGNLMVVGDDDQSIYSWRGADVRNILDFERDFPNAHLVRLETNYRSTARILRCASSVISHNRSRKAKTLRTDNPPGDFVKLWLEDDERAEGRRCADLVRQALADRRSAAVFYRTNAQSRAVEEAFRAAGLPYVVVGGMRFWDRAEIKDAIAWMRLLVNPRDQMAFERACGAPRRGIGDRSIEAVLQRAQLSTGGDLVTALALVTSSEVRGAGKLHEMAELFRRWSFSLREDVSLEDLVEQVVVGSGLEAAFEKEGDEGRERLDNLQELVSAARDHRERDPDGGLAGFLEEVALVSDTDKETEGAAAVLMTLHTSKGLEFDLVCLTGCEEGLFPLRRDEDGEEGLEEERRLFYVGATRARRHLHLMHTRTRQRFGVREASLPSRFLDEIDPEVLESDTSSRMASMAAASRSSSPSPLRPRSFDPDAVPRAFPGSTPSLPQANPWKIGGHVRHPAFGNGVVVGVHGSGASARLDVKFRDGSTRRLIAGYAGLVSLG